MLAFIDESGKPHPSDSSTFSVYAAVCFLRQDSRAISERLYEMQMSLLGHSSELKANKLLNERTFRRIPEKARLLFDIFDWLSSEAPVTTFAVVMPRPTRPPVEHKGHLTWPYRFLLSRLEACAITHHPESRTIAVFDTQDPDTDLVISRNLSEFLLRDDVGRGYRMLDTAFFVDSRTTPGIQLADLVAGVVRQYHNLGLSRRSAATDFERAIERFYEGARSRTVDYPASSVPGATEDVITGFTDVDEEWLYR